MRPRKGGRRGPLVHTNVTMPPALAEKVYSEADDRGVTLTQVIREALEARYTKQVA